MTRFRQIWNPGCYSSLTNPHRDWHKKQFQCPHGLELLPLKMLSARFVNSFNALSGLYLISTNYRAWIYYIYNSSFNALSGLYLISTKDYQTHSICILKFQCPLGLIPHFYQIMYLVVGLLRSWVSMPSRAYTSFLRDYSQNQWKGGE